MKPPLPLDQNTQLAFDVTAQASVRELNEDVGEFDISMGHIQFIMQERQGPRHVEKQYENVMGRLRFITAVAMKTPKCVD